MNMRSKLITLKNDNIMALAEDNDEPKKSHQVEEINFSEAELLKFPEEASILTVFIPGLGIV